MSIKSIAQPLCRAVARRGYLAVPAGAVRSIATSQVNRAADTPEDDPKKGGHTFWSVSLPLTFRRCVVPGANG